MTQAAEAKSVPLTDPVPGAWIQLADLSIPPVYVPYEAQVTKNEHTGREEVTGYAAGAHIKRLMSDGAMPTNGPDGIRMQTSAETDLQVQLAASEDARRAMELELAALREKLSSDTAVPNSQKRR